MDNIQDWGAVWKSRKFFGDDDDYPDGKTTLSFETSLGHYQKLRRAHHDRHTGTVADKHPIFPFVPVSVLYV